jgi:hypothetical protein
MIFQLMLMRLQENRSPHLSKHFVHFLCVISSSSHGTDLMYSLLEGIQQGMMTMIIRDIWATNLEVILAGDQIELIQIILGGIQLLVNSPIQDNSEPFLELFKILLQLVNSTTTKKKGKGTEEVLSFEDDSEAREFDSTYSKLAYAQIIEYLDPMTEWEMSEIRKTFMERLSELCQRHPGRYLGVFQSALDPEHQQMLQELLQETGVNLQ